MTGSGLHGVAATEHVAVFYAPVISSIDSVPGCRVDPSTGLFFPANDQAVDENDAGESALQ